MTAIAFLLALGRLSAPQAFQASRIPDRELHRVCHLHRRFPSSYYRGRAQCTRKPPNHNRPPWNLFRGESGSVRLRWVTVPPGSSLNSSRTLIHAQRYAMTKERCGAAPLAYYQELWLPHPSRFSKGGHSTDRVNEQLRQLSLPDSVLWARRYLQSSAGLRVASRETSRSPQLTT